MSPLRRHIGTAVLLVAPACARPTSPAAADAGAASPNAPIAPNEEPTAPDGNCLETIVDHEWIATMGPDTACGLAHAKLFATADRPALCADACANPSVNLCDVPDDYWFHYELTAAGSSATPNDCPAYDAGSSLNLHCYVVHRSETPYPPPCTAGRRPPGLARARSPRGESRIAAYLADHARLEAASVVAFRVLAEELRALDAPRDLVARANRAARDERRHARIVGTLATRRGGARRPVRVVRRPPRDLLAVALDNAVEGVVRETYGTAEAYFASLVACSPDVRAAMSEIAEDEAAHAELAFDIAAWATSRLDADGRRKHDDAVRTACASLRDELGRSRRASDLCEAIGLPEADRAVALFDALAIEDYLARA
jgi:hypothetical protein